MGRPREFDMDRVLDTAVRVFRERGYNGASVADLRKATGLTAGSLYKAFNDKRGFFVAALDRYVAARDAALFQRVGVVRTGKEKIRATLESYADASHDREGRLGCMVVGGVMDMDTFDEALAERFRSALSQVEKRFAGYVELGVRDGSLPKRLDVSATAQYLLCVAEGLRVLGKRGVRRAQVDSVVMQAMRALV